MTIKDKSSLLTLLLSIEIFFFSKHNNTTQQQVQTTYGNKAVKKQEQDEKWLKNNHLFGEAIDKIKEYTDRRFEVEPRMKVSFDRSTNTKTSYLDKAKFLEKFSCFSGYMQYVDTKQEGECKGINYEEFIEEQRRIERDNHESVQSNFYNNYSIEEMLVQQTDCGGYLE